MFPSTLVLIPLLLASYVSAHGFVAFVTADGKTDTGNRPFGNGGGNTAIRQITSPDPNRGANNPALNCGPGARRASGTLNLSPGDSMAFDWRGADLSKWPHNTGPMITYLANCGDTPCSDFDSTKARWFKIHQVGRKQGSGDWVQGDLMNGAKAVAKLPDSLAPGNYLVRHEIIALHLAQSSRGAEFYPSCTQIRVDGNGNGRPTNDELVSFPGAYGDEDPGIHLNPFGNGEYKFPGPQIAKFVTNPSSGGGNGGDNGGNNNGNGNPKTSTTVKATSTKAPTTKAPTTTKGSDNTKPTATTGSSTKPKVCKLRKGSSSTKAQVAKATGASYYPRHFSRVMRRMVENGFEARAAAPGSA
jgi:hypothetical protein